MISNKYTFVHTNDVVWGEKILALVFYVFNTVIPLPVNLSDGKSLCYFTGRCEATGDHEGQDTGDIWRETRRGEN